jgi:hypothetical protein
LEYNDIELTLHERCLWGNNVGFCKTKKSPFFILYEVAFFQSKVSIGKLLYTFLAFDIGNSRMMGDVSDSDHCLPFQLITEMATFCGPQNYTGYFDIAGHFHLIDKPILTVGMLRSVVKTIRKD